MNTTRNFPYNRSLPDHLNWLFFGLCSFFLLNTNAFAQKTTPEQPIPTKTTATAAAKPPVVKPTPKPRITVVQKIESLLKEAPQKIPYYAPNIKTGDVLWLNMSFVSAVVENQAEVAEKLRGANIVRVDLVYSDFPKDKTPLSLNQSRLRALANVDSTIFSNPAIQWNVFAQTACTDKKTAAELFHGIVVVYRPQPVVTARKKEVQDLKSFLDELTLPPTRYLTPKGDTISAPEAFTNGFTLDEGEVGGYTDYSKNSSITPFNEPKKTVKDTTKTTETDDIPIGDDWKIVADSVFETEKGRRFMFKRPSARDRISQRKWLTRNYIDPMTGDTLLISDYYNPTAYIVDTTWLRPISTPDLALFSGASMPSRTRNPNLAVTDTVVRSVLNRQKGAWKQQLIVMDVTGSMSPYVAQLMGWFHDNLGDNNLRHFTFFNDGDTNPDGPVGKTGGIYHVKAANFNLIKDGIPEIMARGGGGNAPENDIEALLKGIKACPECNDVVLIADNWAPIRDKSISTALVLLKKPIHIVLCGVDWGINSDYLELAHDTGGSLHLLDTDITDFTGYKEGGSLVIKGVEYVVKGGKLIAK